MIGVVILIIKLGVEWFLDFFKFSYTSDLLIELRYKVICGSILNEAEIINHYKHVASDVEKHDFLKILEEVPEINIIEVIKNITQNAWINISNRSNKISKKKKE